MFACARPCLYLFVLIGSMGGTVSLGYARPPLGAEPAEQPTEAAGAPRVPRHWHDLSARLPAERFTAIAVDPGDPEVLLTGTDGFIFKSDDRGESWRPVLAFPRGLAVIDVGSDPGDDDDDFDTGTARAAARNAQSLQDDADLLFGQADLPVDQMPLGDGDVIVDRDSLIVAAEDLQSQAQGNAMPAGDIDPLLLPFVRQGPGVRKLVFVGASQKTVYAGTARGLYRSVSAGERFTRLPLPGGVFANDIRDVAVDPKRPSRLYLGTASGLFLSRDGAATFERVTGRLGYTPVLSLAIAEQENETLVLVGTERGLFRSWDGATSFREMMLKGLSPFEPILALAYDPLGGVTYAGTGQGLFAGERDASILEARELFTRLTIVSLSVDPLRPRGISVGVQNGGIVVSEDSGITSVELGDTLPANDAFAVARPADDPDLLFVATERGVLGHTRGTGIQVALGHMRELQRRWRTQPTLAELGFAALRFASVVPEAWTEMSVRARLAAYAPQLRASYRFVNGRPNQWQYVILIDDGDPIDMSSPDDLLDLYRDGEAELRPAIGDRHEVFVTATWNLDRLLVSPSEVGLARLRPEMANAEQRIVSKVRALYSAHRRLESELYLTRESAAGAGYAVKLLRLAELTAQMDAMTGGYFLRTLQERGGELEEGELFGPPAATWSRHDGLPRNPFMASVQAEAVSSLH